MSMCVCVYACACVCACVYVCVCVCEHTASGISCNVLPADGPSQCSEAVRAGQSDTQSTAIN